MNTIARQGLTGLPRGLQSWVMGTLVMVMSTTARAQTGSLSEAESTATWVLKIFSPTLMLAVLTILLIGCGIAVYFGRMQSQLFVKILIGSILIFGASTIAPKIVAIFGGAGG